MENHIIREKLEMIEQRRFYGIFAFIAFLFILCSCAVTTVSREESEMQETDRQQNNAQASEESELQGMDGTDEAFIRVWLDEPRSESAESSEGMEGFEWAKRAVFGNNGHTGEYESREAFLSDFGFEDSEPLYQYYDRHHNLLLELYGDREKEQFCGISYSYDFNSDNKKIVEMSGFTINTVQEQKWEEADAFDVKTIYGDDGSDYVEDYEETIEYTPAGKPDYYLSQGLTDDFSDETELIEVMEISYIYRDDDTLFYREYWHNPYLFGTTLCSLESVYDENERVVYEKGSITHGNLEYYYIYEDDGRKPAYCLIVDNNLGYKIANLVQYYYQ